jgi:hypothetical protein
MWAALVLLTICAFSRFSENTGHFQPATHARKAFIRDALSLVLSVAVLDSPFPTVGLVKNRRLRMSRLKTCAQCMCAGGSALYPKTA